jgi:3-hydroxybutyryl-CoA dehydratase
VRYTGESQRNLDDSRICLHNSFLTLHHIVHDDAGCVYNRFFFRPGRGSGGREVVLRREDSTLGFDELSVGDEWESPRRTVTEADVVNFAGVSGDFNPIHMDHETAATGPFRRPIAHGLLGLAIASGLGTSSPRVDTLAFLAITEWKFLQPIFFGDTLRVLTRVDALEPKSRGRRGIVTWRRRIVNQHGATVQEGTVQTLVRSRNTSAPAGPGETNEPADDA